MSSTLNPALPDRAAYPYALRIDMPDGSDPVYLHFDSLYAAEGYARIVAISDGRGGDNVTRYVAVLDTHILYSVELGWNEVDSFTGLPTPVLR